jgi:hypothetical protein
MEEVILWPKRHGDAGRAGWGRGRGVGRAMVIADGPQCGRKNNGYDDVDSPRSSDAGTWKTTRNGSVWTDDGGRTMTRASRNEECVLRM